jgi:hypothetical protein
MSHFKQFEHFLNESESNNDMYILSAIDYVNRSKTARFEPDFGAETYKYSPHGKPNTFVSHDKVGKYKAIGSKGGYTEVKSKVILAYDEHGDIVGAINISLSEPVGAFKIVVREDAQRLGWGVKLLSEAEAQGFDMVGYMRENTFSYAGRHMAIKWLQSKLTKKVTETFEPRRVEERENDDNQHAHNRKLYKAFKRMFTEFHEGTIDLDELEKQLLAANPYEKGHNHYDFYKEWVEENIEAYKDGEKYRLSMTSSGGMLASMED